jgi:hypothetical protein
MSTVNSDNSPESTQSPEQAQFQPDMTGGEASETGGTIGKDAVKTLL